MIKSNLPKGHHWTYASDFQRTKCFREICFEDCITTKIRILAPDSDDEPSRQVRATKKRKIEKLVHEFLDGKPLFISSARPGPSALKTLALGNKNRLDDVTLVNARNERSIESEKLWEEVEDGNDILENFRHNKSSRSDVNLQKPRPNTSATVSARSHFRATRRTETTHISLAKPSGASSRARKVLHKSKPQHATGNVSSVAPRKSARYRRIITTCDEEQEYLEYDSSKTAGTDNLNGPNIECARQDQSLESDERRASYHTAPEPIESLQPSNLPGPAKSADEDSQELLLRQRGIQAKPRRSWTALNTPQGCVSENGRAEEIPAVFTGQSVHERGHAHLDNCKAHHTSEQPASDEAVDIHIADCSLQPSTHPSVLTDSRIQTAVNMDAPINVPNPLRNLVQPYTAAAETQSGTTPLQYRRRAAKPNLDVAPRGITRKTRLSMQRRRVDFSTPQTAVQPSADGNKMTAPPRLELSFDSEFLLIPTANAKSGNRGPSNALLEDPLPSAVQTPQPQIIRGKYRASGNNVCRNPEIDAQSSTSQSSSSKTIVNKDVANADEGVAFLSRQSNSTSQFWPGTQTALDNAQFDLFNSPEKHIVDFDEHVDHSSLARSGATRALVTHQKDSQDPMPSTQQLIEAFTGWSTIKKPGIRQPRSAEATPVGMGKNGAKQGSGDDSLVFSDPVIPFRDEDFGQNSLRYSLNSTESSLEAFDRGRQPLDARLRSTGSLMNDSRLPQSPLTTQKAWILRQQGGGVTPTRQVQSLLGGFQNETYAADTTAEPMTTQTVPPSYEGAQLLRDESDLSQVVNDLAKNVLGSANIEGFSSPT